MPSVQTLFHQEALYIIYPQFSKFSRYLVEDGKTC
uniref:Uncharacterized protein n=1 Tax=Anguilla anguilla TaxID=7936 RepID=A0A0E9TA30_ANGAN